MWTGNKEQLINCFNNLNKKHNSFKFKYQISETSITFLDTVSSQNNKLVTKSLRKALTARTFFV